MISCFVGIPNGEEKEERKKRKKAKTFFLFSLFLSVFLALKVFFLSISLSTFSNGRGNPALVRRDPVLLLPRHHGRGLPAAAAPEEARRRRRGGAAPLAADAAGDGREHAAEPDGRGRDLGPAAHRRLLVEGAHEQAEEECRGAQGV